MWETSPIHTWRLKLHVLRLVFVIVLAKPPGVSKHCNSLRRSSGQLEHDRHINLPQFARQFAQGLWQWFGGFKNYRRRCFPSLETRNPSPVKHIETWYNMVSTASRCQHRTPRRDILGPHLHSHHPLTCAHAPPRSSLIQKHHGKAACKNRSLRLCQCRSIAILLWALWLSSTISESRTRRTRGRNRLMAKTSRVPEQSSCPSWLYLLFLLGCLPSALVVVVGLASRGSTRVPLLLHPSCHMELLLADVLEAGRRLSTMSLPRLPRGIAAKVEIKNDPRSLQWGKLEEQIFRIQNSTNGHLMDLEFLCYSFTALLAHD